MFGFVAMLLYFLVAFVLYYWVDLKSLEQIPFEKTAAERYRVSISNHRNAWESKIVDSLRGCLGSNEKVDFNHSFVSGILPKSEEFFGVTRIVLSGVLDDGKMFDLRRLREIGYVSPTYVQCFPSQGERRIVQSAFVGILSCYKASIYQARIYWFLVFLKKVFAIRFRNYGFDGFFPVAVAIAALLAAYNWIDLAWLRELVPPVSQSPGH